MRIPIILGIGTLLYSLLTRYELGIFKIISFKTHLVIDALSGILLAASPWIFSFADNVYVPHLLFGLLEIIVVILTRSQTTASYTNVRHRPAL